MTAYIRPAQGQARQNPSTEKRDGHGFDSVCAFLAWGFFLFFSFLERKNKKLIEWEIDLGGCVVGEEYGQTILYEILKK